ncbi:histone-like nucleoid-structuring protein [Luteimonas aestuarii]|uniref:Histone-like nucleoid-structuring protein n=1 Tax=Luteimonas aestuarii TaxID=453837 RepID=A0A4R5U4Q7_9GAMM|nr:H-NS family nucleoid-associated regulatory protein [Luteimonas aestuarii]TDK28654.1 histone-like nucleoid-structuring protein [Luteimonas aestuarii]
MNKPTLDSIATAKAKLAEELRQLEKQELELRREEANAAHARILELLSSFGDEFSDKQRSEIVAASGAKPSLRAKKAGSGKEVAPKYWLPHTGETWSGRGRPPKAFSAWVGTVSHREWKANHPDEKFPKYPG